MGISTSLVSHYRHTFDAAIRNLNLSLEELMLLDGELGRRLGELVSFYKAASPKRSPEVGKRSDERSAALPGFYARHATAQSAAVMHALGD
jgi:hypothetical protein